MVFVTGSINIDGRFNARLGDIVLCEKHGQNKIIEGDHSTTDEGLPVVLDGHLCACGCQVVGTGDLFVSSGRAEVQSSFFPVSDVPLSSSSGTGMDQHSHSQFDDAYVLRDLSGMPLAHVAYAIERYSGKFEYGNTDINGRTHLLSSVVSAETINLYLAG